MTTITPEQAVRNHYADDHDSELARALRFSEPEHESLYLAVERLGEILVEEMVGEMGEIEGAYSERRVAEQEKSVIYEWAKSRLVTVLFGQFSVRFDPEDDRGIDESDAREIVDAADGETIQAADADRLVGVPSAMSIFVALSSAGFTVIEA